MRAGLLACGAGKLIGAKIAFGGLQNRLIRSFVEEDHAGRVADLDHPDRIVGTTVGTGAATDAGPIVDPYDSGRLISADRARRTTNHAHRIDAVHAGIGDHELVVFGTLANKTGVVVVCGGTGANTIVAARAAIEIDQHRFGAIEKAMVGEEVECAGINGRWFDSR